MPLPALVVMPCSGVTVPLELTPALPPPAVCGLVEASAPITAIDVAPEPSGSTEPEFFSKTAPSSATLWAVAWCAAEVAVAEVEPVGVLSNSPNANISVSTCEVSESRVAFDTEPLDTALLSAVP